MIAVNAMSKAYGATLAVDSISFEVHPREVMGFLGPNGAGKTTTLRMLSGYLPPSSGTAVVAGCDIREENLEVRRKIGYLPENNPLYEEMDVSEYLAWVAKIRGFSGASATSRLRSAVESCGLGDVLGKPIGLLSKGYRQRTGLAAAILHDPEVLLLDEPTSGLDPNQTHEVRELILQLKSAKTVLLSTHILSEVQASCDRVVILHRGKIAISGSPKELAKTQTRRARVQATLKAAGLDLEKIRRALEKLQGIERLDASLEDGEIHLTLEPTQNAEDLRESIFRMAVDKGWTLLELRREEFSLENVFRELTPT